MDTKHTPGPLPWFAWEKHKNGVRDRLHRYAVLGGQGSPYAIVADNVRTKEAAQLLASAPELLEALRALEVALIRDMGAGYSGVALCQAVIAKATGK